MKDTRVIETRTNEAHKPGDITFLRVGFLLRKVRCVKSQGAVAHWVFADFDNA